MSTTSGTGCRAVVSSSLDSGSSSNPTQDPANARTENAGGHAHDACAVTRGSAPVDNSTAVATTARTLRVKRLFLREPPSGAGGVVCQDLGKCSVGSWDTRLAVAASTPDPRPPTPDSRSVYTVTAAQ